MKKIIALLTLSLFFVSCSNDSNNSNNNNPSNGNVNYYFKININGVEHKVQGNTSDWAPNNNYAYHTNRCMAQIGTTTGLQFAITDITKPDYVSGQVLNISIYIPNCQVGLNQANLFISESPIGNQFLINSGIAGNPILLAPFSENSGLYCGNSFNCQYPLFSQYNQKITVNITDLGTPSTLNLTTGFNYGRTVKGNFSGPIYFGTSSTSNGVQIWNMNTPMQFSMEFEAYRIN